MMMNSFDPQRQQEEDSLKRRWQQIIGAPNNSDSSSLGFINGNNSCSNKLLLQAGFHHNNIVEENKDGSDDDLVSTLVPPVTVVLEGRSICQRISLHNIGSYQSLAKALRQMFVDNGENTTTDHHHLQFDLSNAIPGHLIAYEDMENDLLLAGDLSWKDFVRVAKRIRILPAKGNTRKGTTSTRGA